MKWIAGAWRRLGWRHVLLAILFDFLAVAFGPLGGPWLYTGRHPPAGPIVEVLSGRWFVGVLPLFFAAMVADEACDAGVAPFVAYGSALAISAILLPAVDPMFTQLIGMPSQSAYFNAFLFTELLLEGGFTIAAWGYWHVTRRSIGMAQTAEADRVHDQQRLFSARLLTLQARVEPQFLFDALSKVRETHERDARFADALLTDMITLLRAMLPLTSGATSSVERELGLAGAWVRVQRQLGGCAELEIVSPAEAANWSVGPMLVLPMLRTVFGAPAANVGSWRLAADLAVADDVTSGGRLRITLMPADTHADAANAHSWTDIAALRERVAQLHGTNGSIAWVTSTDRIGLVLDLPHATEDAQRLQR